MNHRPNALVILLAVGCAPTLTGGDEVADLNVDWVASRDAALDDGTLPEIDALVEAMIASNDGHGCAVGLVEDGATVYLKGYGTAHVEAGRPYGVDTVSPVGSVAKTLTALGVMTLVDYGDVDLDQPADTWLPIDVPVGDYTLRELLSHRGGVVGPGGVAIGFDPGEDVLREPRLAYHHYGPNQVKVAVPPNDAPYSNVDYSVAGAVIDQVVQHPAYQSSGYEDYLWHHVARGGVLGVGSPSAVLVHESREDDIATLAQGYDPLGVVYPAWTDAGAAVGWEGPSGGWAMTIGDLARLVGAIQRREIVSASSWDELLADQSTVMGDEYGFGMWHTTHGGADKLSHGGDIAGYSAFWASYETGTRKLGVALQCNFPYAYDLEPVADDIHTAYFDLPPAGGIKGGDAVGTEGVVGKRFPLDLSAGSAAPFGIPGSFLAPLTLSVDQPRGATTLDVTLDGAACTTWRATPFTRDPAFVTAPSVVQLGAIDGTLVTLEGAVLEGTFADRGDRLDALSLAGKVDTRTLPALWTLGRDACVEARLAGAPCEPCADGAESCVPVRITGWTAAVP